MGVIQELIDLIDALADFHPEWLTDRNERADPKEERAAQKLREAVGIDWSRVELADAWPGTPWPMLFHPPTKGD